MLPMLTIHFSDKKLLIGTVAQQSRPICLMGKILPIAIMISPVCTWRNRYLAGQNPNVMFFLNNLSLIIK